jgi:NADPH-dependent glutamate synthase beta subunit-like oxidoreductase/Pyruvate/2-oxoacid:ferredoxin oxidoreductase delta subunit
LQLTAKQESNLYAGGSEAISVNKTGEWRFLTPFRSSRLSPCRQSCLLDGEIPAWLEAVKQKKWAEAWEIMSLYNPFPAITGYVCFSPCHESCNRGQLDQGIDIRSVEKAIGMWRLEHYQPPERKDEAKKKVAIVGSGPAGLSCAYYLAEAGYRVTVFERSAKIGGMLALGIPEYRLPRDILTRELAILKAEGIDFQTNKVLGEDFQLDDLFSHYDQVFLATGAWLARESGIAGVDNSCVYNALDFLCQYNRGEAPDVGKTVVVVGGGNAAIDSARSALRIKGVQHVAIVYRRSRLEMPADQHEVDLAEKEGVELLFNALPREVITREDRVIGVKIDYCRTEKQGLVVDRNKSFLKDCDFVIMALGQIPDLMAFGNLNEEQIVFAGGDLISGPATVPEAIKAGRYAAEAIRSVYEEPKELNNLDDNSAAVSFENLNLAAKNNLELKQRNENPVTEAERCLGCGTCNSCGICYLFCPDLAVAIVNGRFEFNLDYCKGCGICVNECPARALEMKGGSANDL